MKVLFLNPAARLGGAERSLLDLMASIRSHAPEVALGLVAGEDGDLVSAARELGVEITLLPLGDLGQLGDGAFAGRGQSLLGTLATLGRASARTAGYLMRLREAIRRFRPSVIHSNGIKTHLFAAASRGRVPLVWHIRDFLGERAVASHLLRAASVRAQAAIAISHAVAADAQRLCPRLPFSVVHNAIDTARFDPAGRACDLDALAGMAPAPPGTFRVGLVATYARWKGHDVFLDAARRFLASASPGVSARFYVVGGAIYSTAGSQFSEHELRAMARQWGIEGQVGFLPFQDAIDQVYRSLDLVVHTSSRPEPFGRTIVEAMAARKPVIVAREGGAAELFEDGVTALGVAPRDPGGLATSIAGLAADPARRAALARAGHEAAVARFSRDRLAPQVLRIYGDAVNANR